MSSDSDEESQSNQLCRKRPRRTCTSSKMSRMKSYNEDSDCESSTASYSDTSEKDQRTPKNTMTEVAKNKLGTRSSERIRVKQSKVFSMPSKKDVWKNISSDPSTSKVLNQLKPRKIVNDFTKITHRYNYDRVYTDDEDSSLGGFIASGDDDDDDDSDDDDDDDDDDDEGRKRKKSTEIKTPKKKIVGYRKRIQQQGESSTDSDGSSNEKQDKLRGKNNDDNDSSDQSGSKTKLYTRKRSKNNDNDSSDQSGSKTKLYTRKRRKSTNIIVSDENSSNNESELVRRNSDKDKIVSNDESDSVVTDMGSVDAGTRVEEGKGHGGDFSSDEYLETTPIKEIIKHLTPKKRKDNSDLFTNFTCNKSEIKWTEMDSCQQGSSNLSLGVETCRSGHCKDNIIPEQSVTGTFTDSQKSGENVFDNGSSENSDMLREVNNDSVEAVPVIESSDSSSDEADNVSPSKKVKKHVIESSDSDTEDSSDSDTEDSSTREITSRAKLQQQKRNLEQQKKFENFKEARKKYATPSKSSSKKF